MLQHTHLCHVKQRSAALSFQSTAIATSTTLTQSATNIIRITHQKQVNVAYATSERSCYALVHKDETQRTVTYCP